MPKLSGFTFVEVIVSLLLLSLILLGFNAMQLQSLRETQNAYDYSVAALQLNAMIERLRALDRGGGLQEQIAIWNLQNKQVLPQGKGEVAGETIKITWGRNECLKNSPDTGAAPFFKGGAP